MDRIMIGVNILSNSFMSGADGPARNTHPPSVHFVKRSREELDVHVLPKPPPAGTAKSKKQMLDFKHNI